MTTHPHPRRQERGQASVELVAVMPFVLLVGLVAWQLALAGHTLWLAANAARVGARAAAVGDDPAPAVRSALPRSLERGLRVRREDGVTRVSVRVPLLLRRWDGPLRVGAAASLGEGG